jgi:hypothetical protein
MRRRIQHHDVGPGLDLRPGCYASFAMSAGRHSRRAPVAGLPPVGVSAVLTLAPGSSPWRLQPAHAATPAYVTDGDGKAGMRRARSGVRCAVQMRVLRVGARPELVVLRGRAVLAGGIHRGGGFPVRCQLVLFGPGQAGHYGTCAICQQG